MSDQLDLGSYTAAAHHVAFAPARLDSVVEVLACVARQLIAFGQRRPVEVVAAAGTSEAADSLAVAADTDRVIVVAVGTGRDCRAAEEAARMHHRAGCLVADFGHARRYALERTPEFEQRRE